MFSPIQYRKKPVYLIKKNIPIYKNRDDLIPISFFKYKSVCEKLQIFVLSNIERVTIKANKNHLFD